MICSVLVLLAVVSTYVWQDGLNPCNDGNRYCSGTAQPTPFQRRFCGWHPWVLVAANAVGLGVVALSLGGWKHTLLFVTLPGVWFCVTRPTTVDLVAMGLAWATRLCWLRGWYFQGLACSLAAGFIHERGPVFAALYSWSPWPLLGLVTSGWWRNPAPQGADPYTGHTSLRGVLASHKPTQDLLDWQTHALPLRGVIPLAAWLGVPMSAWFPLGLATASRVVGTDVARIVMWGAPALVVALPDVPLWAVAIHVLTFRRQA